MRPLFPKSVMMKVMSCRAPPCGRCQGLSISNANVMHGPYVLQSPLTASVGIGHDAIPIAVSAGNGDFLNEETNQVILQMWFSRFQSR